MTSELKIRTLREMERVLDKNGPSGPSCITVTREEHEVLREALSVYRGYLQMGGRYADDE